MLRRERAVIRTAGDSDTESSADTKACTSKRRASFKEGVRRLLLLDGVGPKSTSEAP